MRLLTLLLVLFLFVGLAYGQQTYVVPDADVYTDYMNSLPGNSYYSYGGCSYFWVGYHNEFLNNYHQRLIFATRHLANSLIGDTTTNLDSVKIKFYVRNKTVDSVHQFWFRLDSTKSTLEVGFCFGNIDCGTNWARYEEAEGLEPWCQDIAWTTAGGDFYNTDTLFTTHVTDTGWHTWVATSSDGLLAYFENIIDSNSTLDTTREGLDAITGGLILIQDSTGASDVGTEVQFMSEDTTVFQPEITFYGNWSTPPSADTTYIHDYNWFWQAHRQGRSRILHRKE